MAREKPLRWIHGEVKTPPMSADARRETGFLLRELQGGIPLGLPHSRPMPAIGRRCHEPRINDQNKTWRLVYRLDDDAILILEVFEKKTQATPGHVIDACKRRLKSYDEVSSTP